MHPSRTLRFVTALALCIVCATTAHAGSSIRYPEFPPPTLDRELARPQVEAASQPVALFELARAFLAAVFRPSPRVDVYNVNTRETATFYIDEQGALQDPAEVRSMKHIFRCRRTGKRRKMHPGILRILADVARQYPGRTIEIVSAYRAPPYGVRNSKHFHGRAIDLRVRGVKITELRDYLFRHHEHVGVGWYRGQNFVHVDYRPGNHKLGWTSPRRGAAYRFHPKWSRRILDEQRLRADEREHLHDESPAISAR